jgi:hypothetical protein
VTLFIYLFIYFWVLYVMFFEKRQNIYIYIYIQQGTSSTIIMYRGKTRKTNTAGTQTKQNNTQGQKQAETENTLQNQQQPHRTPSHTETRNTP